MAPYPKPIDSSRTETWDLWTAAENFFQMLLLVFIIGAAVKTYVRVLTRRDTMPVLTTCQEKEDKSKATWTMRQKFPLSSQPNDQNARLQALEEELSHAVFKPVPPWIAPPTPLPGPYDAPYYPLPSIKRQSNEELSGTPRPINVTASHLAQPATVLTIETARLEKWLPVRLAEVVHR